MFKTYVINEERFSHLSIMGYSPMELIGYSLKGNFELINDPSEAKADYGDYLCVLYCDTPLVSVSFLSALAERGDGFVIGEGFFKKVGYTGKLFDVNDVHTKQIKSLGDVGEIYAYVKEKSLQRFNGRNILFYDKTTTYVDLTVEIGEGAIIHPMVTLKGKTKIGNNAIVFSHCELIDTVVGENVDIRSTYALEAEIGNNTTVGPFACLRKGAKVGSFCRVGDFVEVKNSVISDGVKMAHLAYVGDSTVGENTNVGCGTVFANYNGKIKQRCTVGKNVFIGANTNLVAPIQIEDGAYIAAGSTVTHDVPGGNLCIARSRQVLKDKWERK